MSEKQFIFIKCDDNLLSICGCFLTESGIICTPSTILVDELKTR